MCAVERRRPPETVDVLNFFGDVDIALGGYLLLDERHREQRREIVRANRLPGAGMQRRRWRRWHVGHDVVPTCGHFVFVKQDLVLVDLAHHSSGPTGRLRPRSHLPLRETSCTRDDWDCPAGRG